jgi:hypothetical protein
LRDMFLERFEFENVANARATGSWHWRKYNPRPRSLLSYAIPKEADTACGRNQD